MKIFANRTPVLAGLLLAAAPANAEAPERLYGSAPSQGHSLIEYNGQFLSSRGGHRPHEIEFYHGVGKTLALGIAAEGVASHGEFEVEKFSVGAHLNLSKESPVKVSALVQTGITTDGNFPQLEGRLIAQTEAGPLRMLGNAIVRRVEHDEDEGTYLGYAAVVDGEIADHVRLGVEASGQFARLEGFSHHHFHRAHYAGPSLTAAFEMPHHRELELGVKYLRRLDSDHEYRDTIRLVAGFHW